MKCSEAPTVTKSMRVALQDLSLDRLFVVGPNVESYPLAERIEVCSLHILLEILRQPQ